MAEWSCSGLQSRLRRFDSDPSLHKPLRTSGNPAPFVQVARRRADAGASIRDHSAVARRDRRSPSPTVPDPCHPLSVVPDGELGNPNVMLTFFFSDLDEALDHSRLGSGGFRVRVPCQWYVDDYRDGSGTRHARAVRPGPARFRRDEAQRELGVTLNSAESPAARRVFLFVRAGARARRGGCRA